MKYFINYAYNRYVESQNIASKSAEKFGFEVIKYEFKDLDEQFLDKNKKIINQKRGVGYWIWKPYLILKTLNQINMGDYLVYMDSGANLVKPVDDLLDTIDDSGILSFQLKGCPNRNWIKGDCFFAINQVDDVYKFKDEEQILASFIFFKKTTFALNFVKKWLYYSEQEQIVTDLPNIYMANCKEFIDHRHDQAIFSLLCYQNKIKNIPDISQWCKLHNKNIDYIRIHHHRDES